MKGHDRERDPGASTVVHVHAPSATSWNGETDFWNHVSQPVVDRMVDEGMMALTGKPTVADAWRAVLPSYAPGEAIAIKANFNNAASCSYAGPEIDALMQPINAIVRGMKAIGVEESDIWVYDAIRARHPARVEAVYIRRVLADPARRALGREVGQPVDRDGAGEEERDRAAERPRLLDRQPEQVQRALDVDLVGGLRHELRARREQRRQVEDDRDLELALEPLEQVAVEDVADAHGGAAPRHLGRERAHVERQHVVGAGLGQPVDQAVPHLPAGTGHEHDGLARHRDLPLA